MKARIYRINKDNPAPQQANPNDAGYDCFASEDVFFFPNEIKLVPLGIIAEAPQGFHWKLCLRSSMARKRGFMLANGVGIIDSSYSGPDDEIKALLKAPNEGFEINEHKFPLKEGETFFGFEKKIGNETFYTQKGYMINKGDRIAQLILEKNNEVEWDEQEERDFAGKSRGGFGSTGK